MSHWLPSVITPDPLNFTPRLYSLCGLSYTFCCKRGNYCSVSRRFRTLLPSLHWTFIVFLFYHDKCRSDFTVTWMRRGYLVWAKKVIRREFRSIRRKSNWRLFRDTGRIQLRYWQHCDSCSLISSFRGQNKKAQIINRWKLISHFNTWLIIKTTLAVHMTIFHINMAGNLNWFMEQTGR